MFTLPFLISSEKLKTITTIKEVGGDVVLLLRILAQWA
jgi:hypothetical protein